MIGSPRATEQDQPPCMPHKMPYKHCRGHRDGCPSSRSRLDVIVIGR